VFEALRRDASRYRGYGGWWLHLGFWAVAVYRLGAWARAWDVPGLSYLVLAVAWMLRQPFRLLLHLELPSRARIGPGFALIHPYNVLIGPSVQIGADCTLYHEVTLGNGPIPGEPRLGDRVVMFAGARAFGGITIGEATEVGANCVVFKDVPPRSLVVSVLPRVLPQSLVPRPSERPRAAPLKKPGP